MTAGPEDRPVFIGGTGSDGAASLALLLSHHPHLLACSPVRFGVISDPDGLIDALELGRSMLRTSKTPWWERLLAEKQPAFSPVPMMGEDRTPPEEFVELLHRRFLPDPLLKPLGHRAAELTPAIIEAATERYLSTFWDNPVGASINLVHDLLRPTHATAGDRPAQRWIDASRLGAVRAPLLLELFPQARFVHIVRDGREVALRFMEVSTGSAFPGAPESSVPIDANKEWNQAAFERGLALWERRLLSASSGISRVPAERTITVRVADLVGPPGAELLRSIMRTVGEPEDEAVLAAVPDFLGAAALHEGRAATVVPPAFAEAVATAYNTVLARLDDFGVPLP